MCFLLNPSKGVIATVTIIFAIYQLMFSKCCKDEHEQHITDNEKDCPAA